MSAQRRLPAVHEAADLRSGSGLRWLLSGMATVTLVFGVLAYKRFAESEVIVRQGLRTLDEAGKTLSADECVDRVVKWHRQCGDEGGNEAVCFQAVKLAMFHCLAAQPRDQACRAYDGPQLDPSGRIDPGDWVFMRCVERGMACKKPKECACAQAFRSLESFCVSGQKAVQL